MDLAPTTLITHVLWAKKAKSCPNFKLGSVHVSGTEIMMPVASCPVLIGRPSQRRRRVSFGSRSMRSLWHREALATLIRS
jgi:hypothetical protein